MSTRPDNTRAAFSFGIATSRTDARAQLELVCNDVRRRSGLLVYPQVVPSYSMLSRQLAMGSLDIAWAPPLVALELDVAATARVVACAVRDRGASYYTALFSRADSGIRSIRDLRGARMAWVSGESMSGYIVPRAWVATSGVDPDELFASETFYQTHDAVVAAVLRGNADAGATHAALDAGTRRVVDAGWRERGQVQDDEITVIATAGPIPSDTIVVSERVPDGAATTLVDALEHPAPAYASALRDLFGTTGFKPATAAHLAPLARLQGLPPVRTSLPPAVT